MTITEIAQEAGVSIATVSRFLNNGSVKEETKKKLEQVIRKLNYVPESVAKQMVSAPSRNKAIAIISHSMSNPYVSEFVEAVASAYNARGIACYTGYCTDGETEYRYLMDVITRGVDGIILHDPAQGVGEFELYNRINQRFPVVIVHSSPGDIECNSISVDQKKGMRNAMNYLFKLGHRHIAYVCGTEGYSFEQKEHVWREELQKAGITPDEQDIIKADKVDFEAGIETTRKAVLHYLKEGKRPTAIFTANDIMALGTLEALKEEGLSVPGDISIMSHDDTLIARFFGLTCVNMMMRSVGIAAIDLLDYATNGTDTIPRHISIVPTITERSSCRKIGDG